MFYIRIMMKVLFIILVLILAAWPNAAWAINLDSGNPESIKSELERMRVLYTEDHPDVQILKKRLKRAQEVEKEKKQQRGQVVQSEPQPEPGQQNRYLVIPQKMRPPPTP